MKLIFGIGVNDLPRGSISHVNSSGKRVINRFYSVWSNMIQRCYFESTRGKYKTYENCSVCDEWLTLSNFKEWFDKSHFDGWHLDKDLINPRSKCYNPENCRFIPKSLNNLFTDMKQKRGKYKIGVSYSFEHKKFRSSLNVGFGNQIHLGYFDNEDKAHNCYIREKVKFVISEIEQYRKVGVCEILLSAIEKDPLSRIIKE